jgi:hypothetical protein
MNAWTKNIVRRSTATVVALTCLTVGTRMACADHPTTQASSSNAPAPRETFTHRVLINGTRLSDQVLDVITSTWRVRVADGDYWYDKTSGAWGLTGGPTLGFILANLNLGGQLREDASNGDTGVFINGRELHQIDVNALQQFTPVWPGRYWVDARGMCGVEGNPTPLLNLAALANANRSVRSGGDGGYNHSGAGGGVGGDGNGNFYFIDGNSSASSMR